MIGEQVAAALSAPLAGAARGLVEGADARGALVIFNDPGFQRVKALTGPADQLRHEAQWQ